MEREINGKIYKNIPVTKIIINGKEVVGNVISEKDASEGNITATIVADPKEENNKE